MSCEMTGQLLDGKYLLQAKLGEGGMGAVYLGEHAAMGKKVAVKLLHRELVTNEEVVKRFFREARAAAAISHRNIIDVLDMGVTPEGDPYLVMEYLEGRSLESVLSERKQLTVFEACAILEQTLSAIGAAHRRGVVHRDLKPDNIFLSRISDTDIEVKLIDFGISKFQDQAMTKLTVEGTTMGTPAYMSPEQARGAKDLNHTADIYAVGVILYEMLSGGLPYVGDTYNELFANILTSEPRAPETVNPDFPMIAWPVIAKAMSRNATERFQSTTLMMEALTPLCNRTERADALHRMSGWLTVGTVLTGDIGRPRTETRNAPAAAGQVLEDLVRQRTAAMSQVAAPPFTPKDSTAEERTILATPITTPSNPKAPIWPHIQFLLLRSPARKRYRATLGITLVVLASLGFLGFQGLSAATVTVHVTQLPEDAIVYISDSPVSINPFTVTRSESPLSLRIDVEGKSQMDVMIVPITDITIAWEPKATSPRTRTADRRSGTTTKTASTTTAPEKKSAASETDHRSETADEESASTTKQTSSTGTGTKRESKRPLHRLGDRLRDRFEK